MAQTRQQRKWQSRLGSWFLRAVYLSTILGLCDILVSSQLPPREFWFSKTVWAMTDGGTTGHVGFGYCLVYYRRLDGKFGPEIWYWFSPVVIAATTHQGGLRWIWSSSLRESWP